MPEADAPLAGKVAVVIGCSRLKGIGRAIARALAQEGASLVVTGTRRDPATFPEWEIEAGWRGAESLAAELASGGTQSLALPVDVSNVQEVDGLVQAAHDRFGRIDFLVNNFAASVSGDRTELVNIPDETWRRIWSVNVDGLFYCLRAFAKYLIEQQQGGRIVTISSAAGKRQDARTGPYAASKAAVNALTHVLAQELGPHWITVNAVCPGPIPTGRGGAAMAASQFDRYKHLLSIGRLGRTDEVAAMVAHLCGPYGEWITGQTYNVDGGMHRD